MSVGSLEMKSPMLAEAKFLLFFSQRSHEIHEKPKEAHEVQEVASQHHASKIYWALCKKYIYSCYCYELLHQKMGSSASRSRSGQ